MTELDGSPELAVDLAEATGGAAKAWPRMRRSTAGERAVWLMAVASALEAEAESLIELADEESHLGRERLRGELTRTTRQLRLFADVVEEGSYLEVTIDSARPGDVPPSPDLRRMLVPLGPVAVFTASNFPFAFSVSGGDTASALAAGCPVIVKGHSAHPRLSLRTADLVTAALRGAGAPEGVFGHVTGRRAGADLVRSPVVAAVGFTGSLAGGRALFDLAMSRPDPIPFYGELSALNPVVITAAAAAARAEELVAGLAGSFQLGRGQFCTKPGIVLTPAGSRFAERLADHFTEPGPLLSPVIGEGFRDVASRLAAVPGMERFGAPGSGPDASPLVFRTTAASVIAEPDAHLVECFGPATLVVEYGDPAQVVPVLRAIGGSLTATVHAEPEEEIEDLVEELTQIAGRVLFAGWPTGVSVGWAQHHGGPWPATTAPHTSVGTTAVRRFLRPLAWQSAPQHVLPPELRDGNPLGIPRRVDGVLEVPGGPR